MKNSLLLLCLLLPCYQNGTTQQLSATSLVLTGPQNSQEIGGVGSAGDSSCPSLSGLPTGQYAICYLQSDSALELGYPSGSYSPIARMSDLQATQASLATQIATLSQQVAALQSQLTTATTNPGTQTLTSGTAVLDVVMYGSSLSTSSFTPVPLVTVNVDTASAFSRAYSTYVVPSSGYYLVITKMRLLDGIPAGISYGQGVGTQLADQTGFLWSSTSGNGRPTSPSRNSSVNTSVIHYNQGDHVMMYTYLDYQTLLPVDWAEMTLIKIGN